MKNPDPHIDRVLSGIRDTEVPAGLEARIAARIAARLTNAVPSSPTPSRLAAMMQAVTSPLVPFDVARLYAAAATLLFAITLVAVRLHQQSQAVMNSNPQTAAIESGTGSEFMAKASAVRAGGPPSTSVGRSPTYTPTPTTRGPEARSISSTPAAPGPDALALAETLAPSHPAPPMPLTAQEHLLVAATRQGQPIELAELETLRQPALQASAEARQNAIIRRYAQALLGPLAAAQALNPSFPQDDAVPAPEPPSSR